MMRTRNNFEWRHQQKSYQNKGVTWEPSKPGILKTVEPVKKEKRIKNVKTPASSHKCDPHYDYAYSDGWVDLSTFVSTQFKFNMDDVCEETAELGEKVASNSLILKKILSHLNFWSLKSARLVSREWKTMANSELGRKNCCRKRFQCGFLVNENFDLEVLRNSLDLSWMEFDLGNLDETELEYILTFCAGQIKMLRAPPSQFLLRLLHDGKFLNLKSLSFKNGGNFGSTTTTKNPLEKEFRNLLKLLRENSNSTVDEAKVKPKLELERFVIEDQDFERSPEIITEIHRIFESSQKTLKFLEIPSEFSFGLSGSFSQLSTIYFHINVLECFLSPKFQFQLLQSFVQGNVPNLKTVRFEFSDCERNYGFLTPQNSKVQNSVCFNSVINLELAYKSADADPTPTRNFLNSFLLSSVWFPWMSASFPNVQNLTLGNFSNKDSHRRRVFTVWPNLVSLEIQSNFNIRSHRTFQSRDFYLDPVLTGLSQEMCEQLRNNQKPEPMSQEILEMKTWPNLNSLKGLKRLDIYSSQRPVSKISALYAFDLNPELKVSVHPPKKSR